MKNCKKCLKKLPFSDFYSSKKNKDGLQSYCKICSCFYRTQNYKENRDREKTVRKLYEQKIKKQFFEYKNK